MFFGYFYPIHIYFFDKNIQVLGYIHSYFGFKGCPGFCKCTCRPCTAVQLINLPRLVSTHVWCLDGGVMQASSKACYAWEIVHIAQVDCYAAYLISIFITKPIAFHSKSYSLVIAHGAGAVISVSTLNMNIFWILWSHKYYFYRKKWIIIGLS